MKISNSTRIIIVLCLVIIGLLVYLASLRTNFITKDDELFDKQERCVNNRENAQTQLDNAFSLATPYFYDIFYSPKTKTCIYTYGLLLSGQSPNEIGSFVIADYFTGKQLYSVDYDNSLSDESQFSYTKRPEFIKMVEQYRN